MFFESVDITVRELIESAKKLDDLKETSEGNELKMVEDYVQEKVIKANDYCNRAMGHLARLLRVNDADLD